MNEDGYRAIWHGPGGGAGVSCRAIPRGGGIEVRCEGAARALVPYAGLGVSVAGVDDRYLCFEGKADGDVHRLLVPDRAILPHLEAIGAPRAVVDQLAAATRTRSRRKAGRLGVLAVLAAVLAGLALAVWAGFAWAVDRAVERIPRSWEVELGRTTAEDVLAQHDVCADRALDAAVREIGRRLVAAMGATPYSWRIRVLDSSEVNAFALPGGYLFVHRGLIEEAADWHEVAGVLAHECAHVLERHGVRNLAREIGLMIIVYAAVGDAGAVERFLVGNAAGLASMSFSRDQEREADRRGLELVYAAGFDPTGLPRFLRKLSASAGMAGALPAMLSTHPDSSERAAELDARIRAWGLPAVTPLSTPLERVAGRCEPRSISDPDRI